MTIRTVTGNIIDLAGVSIPNATFSLVPETYAFGTSPSVAVFGDLVTVVADGSGDVSFDLHEGKYLGRISTTQSSKTFRLVVDSEGPWTLGRLIEGIGTITDSMVSAAFQAALDAETQADRAEAASIVAQSTVRDSVLFESRPDFIAATLEPEITRASFVVGGNSYGVIRDPSGPIVQANGQTWRPDGVVSDAHFDGNAALAQGYAASNAVPYKSVGAFVAATGSQRRFTEDLMRANPTLGIYFAPRSGELALGVYQGGPSGVCSEYQFGADITGWWRLKIGRSGTANLSNLTRSWSIDLANPASFNIQSGSANSFATTVGARFDFTFQGPALDHYSLTDNRGGVWRYWINGVSYDVSTYNPTSLVRAIPIVRGLAAGQVYQGYAEFIGDDPANAPSGGVGTSRGWIWFRSTAYQNARRALQAPLENNMSILNTGVTSRMFSSAASIQEFAVLVREVGSGDPYSFIPSHNNQLIAENLSVKWFIDGVEIDTANPPEARQIQSATIEQAYDFKQDGGTEILGRLTTRHSLTADGLMRFDYRIFAYQDFETSSFYSAQWAANSNDYKRLILNNGQQFDLDAISSQGLAFNNVNSVLFAGPELPSGGDAVAFAMDVDPHEVYGRGREGWVRSGGSMLLNDRKALQTDNKIYWRTNQNGPVLISAGETFRTSIRWFASAATNTPMDSLTGQGLL